MTHDPRTVAEWTHEDRVREIRARRVRLGLDRPPARTPAFIRDEAEYVLRSGCRAANLSLEAVVGPRQFRELVEARRSIAARLKSELGLSYPKIGKMLNRSHSTILRLLCRQARLSAVENSATHSNPTSNSARADKKSGRAEVESKRLLAVTAAAGPKSLAGEPRRRTPDPALLARASSTVSVRSAQR